MRLAHLRTVSFCLLSVLLLTSCASMMPDPNTITTEEERVRARNQCIAMYTTGAAAGGAIIGGLIGGSWKGAGIGAAAGGAIGFAYAWGKCLSLYSTLRSQPVGTYQDAAQQTKYNPSQGTVAKIQNFSVSPTAVQPGGSANLNGSYYVMAPDGAKEMKVTETRTVKYFDPSKNQWADLGQVDQEITAKPGVRKADGSFDLPKDVPDGKYKIGFKVASSGKEDMVEKDLTVKKGTAMEDGTNLASIPSCLY